VEGLEPFEIAVLVSVAQRVNNPHDGISAFEIRSDMVRAGFTKIAATLGLKSLLNKDMLESFEDYNNIDYYSFIVYRVTEKGMAWLFTNKDMLMLSRNNNDDDVPF
jgi:hypothetical protein